MAETIPTRSFFFHYPKLEKEIRTPIKVSAKFDPIAVGEFNMGSKMNLNIEPEGKHDFIAVWDTGATNTCITKKAVDAVGMEQINWAQCEGAYGKVEERPVYYGALYLPNAFVFPNQTFIEIDEESGDEIAGADLLIGMDIIGQGDFAITVEQGRTLFSFRFPSARGINFTKPLEHPKIGKYDPCFCMSGKQFKFCHWKS